MNKAVSIILMAMLVVALAMPVLAEPFSDVPQGHWAYDSVQLLQEKGLVEGYPDGLFKGDRAMTRYEMAMVVARVIAKLQEVEAKIPPPVDLSPYATKQDLEAINKLIKEFKGELDALGVRVNNIEDSLGKLTARVEELERVKVSGNFETIATAMGIWVPDANRFGTVTQSNLFVGGTDVVAAQLDPFLADGRTILQGFALSSRIDLCVSAKISDNFKAGGDFVGISDFGDAAVYNQYGVIPTYNTLGVRNNTVNSGNFQANLSTVWFQSNTADWKITGKYGNYNLNNVSNNMFYGVANPYYNFWKADVLPLNGFNFAGRLYDTVDVEVFMAHDINWATNGQTFLNPEIDQIPASGARNYLLGGWVGYDTMENRLHVEGGVMRYWEDRASNLNVGGVMSIGTLTALPLTVRAQEQIMYGFKGHYDWPGDFLTIYGEFAATRFNPDMFTGTYALQKTFSGYLGQIGAKGTLLDKKLGVFGEYVRTSVNYDPINVHKTWTPLYGDSFHEGWDDMTGFWNASRPGKFRPNRHGVDLGVTYKLAAGEIFGGFTYLTQIKGYYDVTDESYFYDRAETINTQWLNMSFAPSADGTTGKEYHVKVGGRYDFGGNLHVFGDYNYYKAKRDYTLAAYDNQYHFIHLGVTYDITDKFSAQGNFAYVKQKTNLAGVTGVDNSTVIPGLGLKYEFNENTTLALDYKFFKFSDNTTLGASGQNDWKANRIMTRLNVKF